MGTKSRQELITRTLNKLGVVGAGQQPEAEDALFIETVISPVLSDLASRNVYVWGDPDQIDDDAFEHLAGLIANQIARDYGKEPDENMRRELEQRLYELKPVIYSRQPQRNEYF